MAEKQNMNVVFIGHVDHGKSTAVGRLLYDSGKLPEQELKKVTELAEKLGKKGFEFAFVMDHLKEERERGVTIDLAYKKFPTNKYDITLIDAPGHRDFVKNMITGTSQADAAILVVAAPEGVMAQTKEHVWLCRTMGVKQVAVLANKMDVAEFSEDKYKKVVEDMSALLKQAGYQPDKIKFIPSSAYKGDNIAKKSENMSWYKGPTLMEALDLFEIAAPPTNLPLRMPIQDVYEITGVGTVPVGKIETGIMKNGDKVIVLPGRSGTGIAGEIRTIEAHHETLPSAQAGDNVGISIRGVGKKDMARGDVIASAANPPKVVKEFLAKIAVINHPTVFAKGYTPVFHVHTAQVPCRVEEIPKKFDPASGAVAAENPDFLKNGDVAEIKVIPLKPLVIEAQADNPHLSGFAIRDAGQTVAAGVCTEVLA